MMSTVVSLLVWFLHQSLSVKVLRRYRKILSTALTRFFLGFDYYT